MSQELHSKVSVLYLTESNGNYKNDCHKISKIGGTFSCMSLDGEQNVEGVSHLVIDPVYNKYLYVGIRFYNKIVKFEIDIENQSYLLSNPMWFDCNGEIPRHFDFDKTKKFLIVCNQEGKYANISVFKVNYKKECQLQLVSSIGGVGSPCCIKFCSVKPQSQIRCKL